MCQVQFRSLRYSQLLNRERFSWDTNLILYLKFRGQKFRGKIKNNPHIAIQLKRMVNRYIGMFINKITEWVSAGKLLIIKVEIYMAKFYKKVRNIQENFFGDILDSYKCKMCDTHHDSYIFRGIDY